MYSARWCSSSSVLGAREHHRVPRILFFHASFLHPTPSLVLCPPLSPFSPPSLLGHPFSSHRATTVPPRGMCNVTICSRVPRSTDLCLSNWRRILFSLGYLAQLRESRNKIYLYDEYYKKNKLFCKNYCFFFLILKNIYFVIYDN